MNSKRLDLCRNAQVRHSIMHPFLLGLLSSKKQTLKKTISHARHKLPSLEIWLITLFTMIRNLSPLEMRSEGKISTGGGVPPIFSSLSAKVVFYTKWVEAGCVLSYLHKIQKAEECGGGSGKVSFQTLQNDFLLIFFQLHFTPLWSISFKFRVRSN